MKTMTNNQGRVCEILDSVEGSAMVKGSMIPARFFLLEEIHLVDGVRQTQPETDYVARWFVRGETKRKADWFGAWKEFKSRVEAREAFVKAVDAAGLKGN